MLADGGIDEMMNEQRTNWEAESAASKYKRAGVHAASLVASKTPRYVSHHIPALILWPRKGVGPVGPAAILVDLPISLAFSAATACSWAEQAFAAGGDKGNDAFFVMVRHCCNGTTLCYTTDLWRTDIQVLVYIIENGVRHVVSCR